MIASDSFVLQGNANLVFPSLLMQEGNFPFVFSKILKVFLGDHIIIQSDNMTFRKISD